jgi:glycosyltransferase involved in cell wall biosynthesis
MPEPLISICIPAYKKPQYVVRCLQSIIRQNYKNVEVIISDDSPDEDIKQVIAPFTTQVSIHYFSNRPALGSPRNWNAALDRAHGDYLMLMHQDDWFHADDALSSFLDGLRQSQADFVFCRNTAVDEEGKETILQALPRLLKEMKEKPNQLVLAQVIGPPSNTLLKRTVTTRYDERFIWLVDVDYYSRLLRSGYNYFYIDRHLVSIGLHEDQTTIFCRNNPDVIFKENVWFAGKIGAEGFRDILIYDYYWRLLRNYKIRSVADMEANHLKPEEIPAVIRQMLDFQKKFSLSILRNGVISKSLMTISYLRWKSKPSA